MMGLYKKLHSHLLFVVTSKASKDTVLLSFLQMVVQLNSLLAVFFVSRYLGPTNLGIMSFAQTFVSFVFFINAGLYAYYAYELAAKPDSKKDIVNTFFRTQIIINGLCVMFGIFALFHFNLSVREFILILTALFITYINSTASFLNTFLLIEKRVRQYVIAGLFTSFSILIARIVGIYCSFSVEYFTLLLVVESIVFLGYLHLLSFLKEKDIPAFTFLSYKEAFRELYRARYFIGLMCATLVFSRVDQLYIRELLSSGDLGLYSAAVRLTEYPSVLLGILGSVLMPRVSQANEISFRRKVIVTGLFLYFILGTVFSLILIFFGNTFIHILYGTGFLGATSVLAVYAFIIPGLWIVNFGTLIFGAFNKIHYGFIISCVGGLLSIALLSYLVPLYGLHGAALSAVISYSTVAILSLIFAYSVSKHVFKVIPVDEAERISYAHEA